MKKNLGKGREKEQITRKRSPTVDFRRLQRIAELRSFGAFRNTSPFAFEDSASFCRILANIAFRPYFTG
jgi:hypothetical protein